MSIIRNIISKLAPKMGYNYTGRESFRTSNPYLDFFSCYENDTYASVYPSIKAIAHEFMTIQPFAIDGNGKQVQHEAVNALYHPNQKDGATQFFEKISVMTLTHRKTYILVWRKDGNQAKPGGANFLSGRQGKNIAGYTFLENPSVTRRDNKTYYGIGAQEFSEDEVITLDGGVDPNNLYGGYAPGQASRRWATLDQYIADYQAGFFENGAVPSGQFVITAASEKDFNDIVDTMQNRHRGAGKNNNVTYTPRPVDPNSGKPADAQIEWIPFASSNKDIDFKNLFEQANNRIDSTFGVPASVRGVGENNNYATAQTDRQNFIRFTVNPLALRVWTQFTHELNRITNGMGIAITYELELPAIADEVKVQAETKNIEVTALTNLLSQGFSLDSAVDALSLSPNYKLLKSGATATKEEDEPDVDDGGEVNDSPDPDKIDGVTPLYNKHDHSDHGGSERTNPKADTDAEYEADMERVAARLMKAQIDSAIAELDEKTENVIGDASDDDIDGFIKAMLAIVALIVEERGSAQQELGIALLTEAGVDTDSIKEFVFNEAKKEKYRTYLKNVGTTYSNETAETIRAVLAKADADGLTQAQIKKNLRDLTDLEKYRVTRIARTETNRAGLNGQVYSMEQIQDESTATINKVWTTTSSAPCPICVALDGTTVGVSGTFLAKGQSIELNDGSIFVNDFVDADIANAHPNDECTITYEVVK